MIKIVIADDHHLMREGLCKLVGAVDGIEVVGEATNDVEVMGHVRSGGFDVLLLDLAMPGRSGIELIRRVCGESPAPAVLVLSMHDERQYAVRAMRAGALGYLTKEMAVTDVIRAIGQVAAGLPYISCKFAEELAHVAMLSTADTLHSRLTDRELQVFLKIAAGVSLTEVAKSLSLSVKTVSTHKARILQRMGMRHLTELIQYAIAHGLLAPTVH